MPPATEESRGRGRNCIATEFLDTNILLYAHDSDTGAKHRRAAALIEELLVGRTGAISFQVLAEFCAVVTRKWRMPASYAEEVCADFSAWRTHYPEHQDLGRACQLYDRFQLRWYDALILNSALQLGCTTLWTEDFSHGQKFGDLTVRNPFAA
jgi:predicted nucleic acid-binding protein